MNTYFIWTKDGYCLAIVDAVSEHKALQMVGLTHGDLQHRQLTLSVEIPQCVH